MIEPTVRIVLFHSARSMRPLPNVRTVRMFSINWKLLGRLNSKREASWRVLDAVRRMKMNGTTKTMPMTIESASERSYSRLRRTMNFRTLIAQSPCD